MDRLWSRYRENLAEKDFPERIQRTFSGPDFRASSAAASFFVEATVPERGRGRASVPELIADGKARDVPIAEMEYRFAKAIDAKAEQLRSVDPDVPAVLFVNMVRASYAWITHDLPLEMLLAGPESVGIADGVPYVRGQFCRDDYCWLSEIVVATTTAWSAAQGKCNLLVMHNPLGESPAPESAWGAVREYSRHGALLEEGPAPVYLGNAREALKRRVQSLADLPAKPDFTVSVWGDAPWQLYPRWCLFFAQHYGLPSVEGFPIREGTHVDSFEVLIAMTLEAGLAVCIVPTGDAGDVDGSHIAFFITKSNEE